MYVKQCMRGTRRYKDVTQQDFEFEAGNDDEYEVEGIHEWKVFGTARFLQKSQKPTICRRSASLV